MGTVKKGPVKANYLFLQQTLEIKFNENKNQYGILKFQNIIKTPTYYSDLKIFSKPPPPLLSYLKKIRFQSKKISNDQELIQSDPISCPQNQKENN